MSRRGFRFFQDDEDEFGLEDILQAVCFLEVGLCWLLVIASLAMSSAAN